MQSKILQKIPSAISSLAKLLSKNLVKHLSKNLACILSNIFQRILDFEPIFVEKPYICPQFKRKIQKTMNITQIQDLIKFVAKSGVSEVEIEQKDFKITIKTPGKGKQEFVQVASAPMMAAPAQIAMPTAAPVAPAAPIADAPVASNLIEIKSPMIGTFYRSASPDKPAFVEVGSEIHVGDKVCIVEAMKLFNEIESEVSGRIVKILVNDMSPIEFDQPLFLVEPA